MNDVDLAGLVRAALSATLATVGLTVCATASAADEDAQKRLGKQLFTQQCAVCHTLRDAGAQGGVGPILDELKPDASRVAKALRDGLGNMPSYKAILSEAQIGALAHYVATASGAEK